MPQFSERVYAHKRVWLGGIWCPYHIVTI